MFILFFRELTFGWRDLDNFPDEITYRALLIGIVIGYVPLGAMGLIYAALYWLRRIYL